MPNIKTKTEEDTWCAIYIRVSYKSMKARYKNQIVQGSRDGSSTKKHANEVSDD